MKAQKKREKKDGQEGDQATTNKKKILEPQRTTVPTPENCHFYSHSSKQHKKNEIWLKCFDKYGHTDI